ncbi:hypothetical protein MLD38_033238 [Melastoma candidum]|uniref:Uncharacterized protein n=1 Tax=Melastoma candidum TaxID=119954 RepID=A0ACB9M7X4_9MYRT|nr:hypothetical protein MLD38_033238 [Melastoma candidum]
MIKALDEPHAEANSSFIHAVINMVGMLIGLGQLSTPFALENVGWASSFLLVSLGVIGAYTSHLLRRCLDENPKLRSYTDIRDAAYGHQSWVIAATFIYLEIFMVLLSYTISLHDNLTIVFAGTRIVVPWPNLSASQLLTTIAILVALPSLWLRDLLYIFPVVWRNPHVYPHLHLRGLDCNLRRNSIRPPHPCTSSPQHSRHI